MSEAARDSNATNATTTEGLDHLFEADLADVQTAASPLVDVADAHVHAITLNEAAQKLGITRRSALRLIQEGKLDAAKDGHGQWLVKTDSIDRRLRGRLKANAHVSDIHVDMDDVHVQVGPDVQFDGQQAIMKELLAKVEALTFRNGYLESQLHERERDIFEQQQQIQLLTDSQHKPGWWARFAKWWRVR